MVIIRDARADALKNRERRKKKFGGLEHDRDLRKPSTAPPKLVVTRRTELLNQSLPDISRQSGGQSFPSSGLVSTVTPPPPRAATSKSSGLRTAFNIFDRFFQGTIPGGITPAEFKEQDTLRKAAERKSQNEADNLLRDVTNVGRREQLFDTQTEANIRAQQDITEFNFFELFNQQERQAKEFRETTALEQESFRTNLLRQTNAFGAAMQQQVLEGQILASGLNPEDILRLNQPNVISGGSGFDFIGGDDTVKNALIIGGIAIVGLFALSKF